MSEEQAPNPPERRSFLKKMMASVIGTAIGLVPFGAGLGVFFDPLRRKAEAREFKKIATLKDLPVGIPKRFPVIDTRTDVWNRYPETPIGAVYLVRTEKGITAFNVTCPHLGCPVGYEEDLHSKVGSQAGNGAPAGENGETKAQPGFFCPCHTSSFGLDGKVLGKSPSKRNLDTLEVQVQGNDVLVKYQKFYLDIEQKIPIE